MKKIAPIDYKSVLSLFLPSGTLDYFDITEASDMGGYIMLCLVEKNEKPSELSHLPLVSNGFHDPIIEVVSKVTDTTSFIYFMKQSPDFPKPGLCHVPDFLYLWT